METLVDGIVLVFTGLAVVGFFVGVVGLATLSGWLIAAFIFPVLLCACWLRGRRWHQRQTSTRP